MKTLKWMGHMAYDYFACFGAMVFAFGVYAVHIGGADIKSISTLWFVLPPLLYSWLRGEIYHWPKEKTDE